MRAVNLIPSDKRHGSGGGLGPVGPGMLVLVGLTVAVVLVVMYVLSGNSISSRQASLASARAQLASEQTLVSRLGSYERFAALAQARAQTIRQIVATRFDWHAALSDLSKVVPANTNLQSLTATVSPSVSINGGSSSLRGAIDAPAFDITGCTSSQDNVARLMSRLRAMNGVTRVTLQSSTDGSSSGTSTSSGGATSTGCGAGPSFHLVVFFAPLASAGAASSAPVGSQQVSTTNTTTSTSTTGGTG